MCKKCGATVTKRMRLLARPCTVAVEAGLRNRQAYLEGKKLPNYKQWPYKKSTIPFEHSLFAECGSERQILLSIQKQVAAYATTLELPIDCLNSGDDMDTDSEVESDVDPSGSSESD